MTWLRMVLSTSFLCVIFLFSASAFAQEDSSARPGGLGIGLGQGTIASGISLKQHTGATALQGVIGCFGARYYYNDCRGIGVSGDYLINMPTFFDLDALSIGWNIGGGVAAGLGFNGYYYRDQYYANGFTIAGQFIAGLELLFPSIPLDFVLEWRPHLRILPSPWFNFAAGGAHVRFYLD